MIPRNHQTQTTDSNTRPKWFNSPVTFHEGTLTEIRAHVPSFERRGFGLTQPENERSRLNERLDTIVRLPFGEDNTFIPVGVVSKDYALVPHLAVLDVATKALADAKIATAAVKAELKITEYGERMALSLYLPDKYSFDPGDGHPMALRLECLNSVDGSTRFRALVGWFRFVCSNGLVIGVTRFDVRRRHVGDIWLDDIGEVLTAGLKESEADKKTFEGWRKAEISEKRIVPWVNKDLREEWGFKAAARTFHIARSGSDAEVIGQYKGSTPTTIAMQETKRVPGAPRQCRNLFDLSQILAWLAKERRDVQEQMEWREKIPGLMAPLLN
ncbi:MAG: DUF945 domain-containing protein [Syntrophobacterales bacterium]|nr:DUF945 domain-containing protein [Syntrophobacterales bacterium]